MRDHGNGRRSKEKQFRAGFLLPVFLCMQINFAREMSGKEAVPQTLILLNSIKTSSNNIIIVFNHI